MIFQSHLLSKLCKLKSLQQRWLFVYRSIQCAYTLPIYLQSIKLLYQSRWRCHERFWHLFCFSPPQMLETVWSCPLWWPSRITSGPPASWSAWTRWESSGPSTTCCSASASTRSRPTGPSWRATALTWPTSYNWARYQTKKNLCWGRTWWRSIRALRRCWSNSHTPESKSRVCISGYLLS